MLFKSLYRLDGSQIPDALAVMLVTLITSEETGCSKMRRMPMAAAAAVGVILMAPVATANASITRHVSTGAPIALAAATPSQVSNPDPVITPASASGCSAFLPLHKTSVCVYVSGYSNYIYYVQGKLQIWNTHRSGWLVTFSTKGSFKTRKDWITCSTGLTVKVCAGPKHWLNRRVWPVPQKVCTSYWRGGVRRAGPACVWIIR